MSVSESPASHIGKSASSTLSIFSPFHSGFLRPGTNALLLLLVTAACESSTIYPYLRHNDKYTNNTPANVVDWHLTVQVAQKRPHQLLRRRLKTYNIVYIYSSYYTQRLLKHRLPPTELHIHRRNIAQTKTLYANENSMILSQLAGLAKTIQALVEVHYLTGHLAAPVLQTEEKPPKLSPINNLLRITTTQQIQLTLVP